jgi:hypothetical protein
MAMKRQSRPVLEPLESVSLLSGLAAGLPIQPGGPARDLRDVSPATTIVLTGQVRGDYQVIPITSGPGSLYTVMTSGKLSPIGQRVTVTGMLRTYDGFSSGPPSGTLKLATARGSLTLEIPKSVFIPSGVPTSTSPNQIFDTYTITKASGSLKSMTGFGVVEFDFLTTQPIGAEPVRTGEVVLTFSPLSSSSTA